MNRNWLAWIPAAGLSLGALTGCSGMDGAADLDVEGAPKLSTQSGSNTVFTPASTPGDTPTPGGAEPQGGIGGGIGRGGETGTLGGSIGGSTGSREEQGGIVGLEGGGL